METDYQRIQDTLGQMIQLSIMTDRNYKLTVRALGTFHLNWTAYKEDHRSDMLWEYQPGRPVRVDLHNQTEVISQYFANLDLCPTSPQDMQSAGFTEQLA